ncbi:Crp/Fnr family transcriptional regulator [Syntrophobacter fumaroxidans]|uniref:Cyclic nucleotide-binding protein n=1 Tax=Syntrophobacter fumaroxidans (strain DSM 10017 / MPOB) TaxID=335543 RepID=A0LNC0_SYNFM|nr:Crp/Fnr family transcriptional regulator [Syntrophobacter fumaroxidans]ABK18922.1 cyclic nucleotide-binding protein [Syntrophobacter fumaroxidans MPOB]
MSLPTERNSECAPASRGRCELEDSLEILRNVSVFAGIPLPRLKLYAYLSRKMCFQAGEFLFHQGDSGDRGYIVISGRLQVIRELKEHSVLLHEFKPGDFFGGMALLSDVNRLFSVRAVTSAECLSLDRESFRKLMIQFPEIAFKVLDMMIRRIVNMEEKLLQTQISEGVRG